jgi:hypothetical protein
MDVGSVSRSGYTPIPTFQDMAAVMAARPSMAQMSAKAAVQASARTDDVTDAIRSASSTGGAVDMYL